MNANFYILYLCLILFSLSKICVSSGNGNQKELTFLLKDFVKQQDAPLEVILFLCCKFDNLIGLFKNATFPIGVQNCKNDIVVDESRRNKILFVIDLNNCPIALKYLENSMNPKYYAHPYRWLMFNENYTNIPNIRSLPDSNIFMAVPEVGNYRNTFQIKQFYKIKENSLNIFEIYGFWNKTTGLIITQKDLILSRRRRNLQKESLTVSVVITNNDSLNHLDDYKDRHIDPIGRTTYLITRHLIDGVNGTLVFLATKTWGYKDPKTGKYNGMIGDLLDKRADIGGAVLFIIPSRIPLIDFISMTTPTGGAFIFRKPPLSYVSNIYSLPFTDLVWISILSLIVIAIIMIFFTTKYERYRRNMNNDKNDNVKLRFSDFILSSVGIVCQMGISWQPKTLPARISTIFLLISALFFYTSYTANIVALLQSTTKSIQTLSDLLKSQLVLAVDDTPYHRYYFPATTEPLRRAIYQQKILSSKGVPRYMNVSDGIAEVRKGLFAFHVELGVAYKIIEETFYEHEKCNLMLIDFLQVVEPWYSIQKNSPYKEILKVGLFKVREFGLQGRENTRMYTRKPICSTNGQSFESVRLNDCYAAFIILSTGFGLAVFLMILEWIFKNRKICLI